MTIKPFQEEYVVMTRPSTKKEKEVMKQDLIRDMNLRKEAYRILKSGDLEKLNSLVPSPQGGPSVTYREVLDCWKQDLETPSIICPVPNFLKKLGVNFCWKTGFRDQSDAIVACPIDFSLLGLDPKKVPDLSHLQFLGEKPMDLDGFWQQQGNHEISPTPRKRQTKGLCETLNEASEPTEVTQNQGRSR